MGGYEATRNIRKFIDKEVPIVALTARRLQEDIAHCLESGMNDYMSKPYTVDQIRDMIIKWTFKELISSS